MSLDNPMNTFILNNSTVTLHRNHGWSDYFSSYTKNVDGTVHLSTYSFKSDDITAFTRLMPFSVFYISNLHKKNAEKFLRRFPMYLVFEVEGLHSKCVFFEKSGRVIFGSQNIYTSTSKFEELACEMTIPQEHRKDVLSFFFSHRSQQLIQFLYNEKDIKIYGPRDGVLSGKAYLPTHVEYVYWEQFGEEDKNNTHHSSHIDRPYIYVILEFISNTGSSYMAFDRLYRFCGNLNDSAFSRLNKEFRIKVQNDVFLRRGNDLSSTSPFKDEIALHHPVAKNAKASKAHYIEYPPN
ncbi:hypothetical protein [Paracidovorax avenae]|nr:hypothetical protein [Paracidovorax avenae]